MRVKGVRFVEQNLTNIPRELLVVGCREVLRGIRAGQIRCVLAARDADDELLLRLQAACRAKDIPLSYYNNKKEAGERLGLDVACAVIGERIQA